MVVARANFLVIFQLLPAHAVGGLMYSSVHEKMIKAETIKEGTAAKRKMQEGKAAKYEMQEGSAIKVEMQEGKANKHGTQEGKAAKSRTQEGRMSRYGTQEGKTTRYAMQEGSTRHGALEGNLDRTALGSMNKMGVTRYKRRISRRAESQHGSFYWGDSSNHNGQAYAGATDLMDNLSWGWHHPSGLYATIPVGSPLIDDEMNIYVGSDDAIRKFSVAGDIIWSYAPRGQLAAAPTLYMGGSRRVADPVSEEEELEEALVRPDWVQGNESEPSAQLFRDFKLGDLVKVKPGARYMADGKELYKEGDQGVISAIVDEGGKDARAVIQWGHSGHKSAVQLHAMKDRFVHAGQRYAAASGSMLVGSTTAGFVFAIDLATGNELWATWASNEIAGVKGSVAAKDGVVVVATDRCTDRYCYRYRNQTNVFTPGNAYVRGLSAADGTAIWEFKPTSPVWNMNPLWGNDGKVMFQDWEGRLYGLDLQTGVRRFRVGGDWGTHTHAAAVYSPGHNVVIAMGMIHYNKMNYHMDDALGVPIKHCNPYVAPGILPHCWTWPGLRGFVRGYNASSGRKLWETSTPEPPSGASIGQVATMGSFSTRLILTMGFNCFVNSPTQIWSMDPNNGNKRWMLNGPTLWTSHCASDKEGQDIRRAMGGRATCSPNSWSAPVTDALGDIYVGNQVGVLQRIGAANGGGAKDIQLLSTLTTGSAFQDAAIAFGDGVMAVSTCTSLLVFQTYAQNFTTETWSFTPKPTHDFHLHGYESTGGTSLR
ncbi:unnamed protein product [Prorocentrum cordatum]|uniref:Pyrrolo-quinoline quinone repeat domain-containing protein n=1 Tax=Prorocentrum cordatum TaxID=2364126 RepID=A0ABN9YGX5_9DINO|nr:unnamed protein product [Polarella glacialis]